MITGTTELLALIADPVVRARTPGLVNEALAARGCDAVLVALRVPASGLADVVRAWRAIESFRGAVVSMPHKEAIVPLLDALTPDATAVGAVNTVRREPDGRLVGTTLDGEGFVGGLRDAGVVVAGRSFFLAGAGGAAAAIAYALGKHGAARLTLHNRTAARADALAARLTAAWPALQVARAATPDPAGHDVAINATALGMDPADPPPFPVHGLARDAVVAEVIAAHEETALLRAAAAHGARVHPGRAMLVAQVGLILDFIGMRGAA